MLSMRSRTLLASLAVCAVTVTGCSEDPPQRAGTLDDPSATAAAGADDDEAPSVGGKDTNQDLSRAGRQLTQQEAKAALPVVSVLPAGWSVDPENTLTGEDGDDSDVSDERYRTADALSAGRNRTAATVPAPPPPR